MPEPITPQTASSSTSTQPTASSSKQPGEKQKQTQQPTSTSQTPAAASTAAQGKKKEGKEAAGKSAKEEKKAKRAAAVAARGGAGGPPAAGPGAPSGGAVGKDGKGKESGKGDRTGQDGTTTAAGIARGDPAAGVVAGTTVATGATSIAAVSTLLFSHLPSSRPPSAIPSTSSHKHLHPLVYRLGLLLSTPSTWTTSSPAFQPQSPPLRGTNARTTALLLTFRQVILDHSWPPREMHRVLPAHLSPMIGFLDGCRPKGVAGGNVIRWLKAEINRVGTDESIRDESEQKRLIVEAIDNYLKERIELAGEVICSFATEKIRDGDTIVTYARSSLVEQVLLEAWKQMKEEDEEASFHVVVVDSGPLLEGKALLRTLTTHSIPCSYTLLSSLASIIPRASLVLLGTAALFSDGSLYSRAGTAAVAMLAKENRIPVVAACETYKFGERVLLDAVTGNELGDASSLLAQEEGDIPTHLTPIHLLYDLTPAALITAICSEVGFIPPSSVPTVISKPGEAAGF